MLWVDLENGALQQLLSWGDCRSAVLHFRAKLTQQLQQAQANFWRYQLSAMFTKTLHTYIANSRLVLSICEHCT